MKIDLEMLERMVATGATGETVLAMVRLESERHEAFRAAKRPADAARKKRTRADIKRTKADTVRTATESDRHAATLEDTPRARLFREGKPALLTLGIADGRAGGLIVQWLKLTNDDDQLVLATILRAQALAVADAVSWILATLKGKTDGNGTGGNRANPASSQSGSAAIIAGVASAAERRGRERSAGGPAAGQAPGNADVAREPDLEFGGAGHG